MGHSQAEKAKTHDRIIEIAAKRFREAGLDGLSIADLMKEAGLTQGGFYKHFESRDDLVTQAVAVALKSGASRSRRSSGLVTKTPAFGEIVDAYLDPHHRDSRGDACAVGALLTDAPRATKDARALYTAQVEKNIRAIGRALSEVNPDDARAKAIVAFSAMIGGVGLARAVNNKKLSDEILIAVRKFLNEDFATLSGD